MVSANLRTDLECVTGKTKPVDGESLRDILKRLDEMSLSEDMPERLQHYLSRRSYVKALEWLDNPDMPHKA